MNKKRKPAPAKKKDVAFLILTGTSGSGKSHALKCLEDAGYYCVDNLPITLIPQFAEQCEQADPPIRRTALVVDVRERFFLEGGMSLISELGDRGHRVKILFFDADDKVLIRRFSETRRPHPLSPDGSVMDGLKKEREILAALRDAADSHIDTSTFSVHDLKAYMHSHYGVTKRDNNLTISLVAFGFKYGIPLDADIIFDVRFLANPHFVPDLKMHTGTHPRVRDYVMADKRTEPLLERLTSLLDMTLPEYEKEGRTYLTIGVGCTGGKHRSVVVAGKLAEWMEKRGRTVEVRLRDANAGRPVKAGKTA